MFRSIVSDFDPRYWSRSATAVLLATSIASTLGTGWLVVELLGRVSWFLLQWLLSWFVPPGIALALLPPPPVTYVLQDAAHDRAIAETVVDLDLGDPTDDPYVDVGDALIDDLDVSAPPPPGERDMFALDRQIARDAGVLGALDNSSGLLAKLIGTTGDSDAAIADMWGDSDGLGDIDNALGGIGGLIGAKGTQIGSGGLGMRGSGRGGGGTAEGLGRIGSIGTVGRGSGGGGSGYGTGGGQLTTRSSVTVEEASIVGELDSGVIQGVIRRHLSQIRYCYERELAKDPNLAGSVTIRFEIEPAGTVSSAEVSKSTLGNDRVGKCVNSRFRRMRFPESDQGATVSYPVVLSPR